MQNRRNVTLLMIVGPYKKGLP